MSVLALRRRRLSERAGPLARAHLLAPGLWIGVTVALISALVGRIAFVGADALWLAALGGTVAHHGIPVGVPFAGAPTGHWPNTLVLAELCFHALEQTFGDGGLIAAQTLAVAAALALLGGDARRRGAGAGPVCLILVLLLVGAPAALTVARVQLFSLALCPVLLVVLHADARAPGRRIWWVLPILALWSNLHGAALLGLAILYPYLLLSRLGAASGRRRAQTLAVALLAPAALCATPALLRTPGYYHGLLTNVATARGVGMWAALGTGTLDLMLIAVAALLIALALLRRTLALWEAVVALALALATIRAARDGVWLLFVLSAPAAVALSQGRRGGLRKPRLARIVAGQRAGRGRDWLGLIGLALVGALAMAVADVGRWAGLSPATPPAVAAAIALAHGSPILADDLTGERIALAGGRIWAGNPIDAFAAPTQARYLDFLAGGRGGLAALREPQIRVALVAADQPAARLLRRDPAYRLQSARDGDLLYQR